MRKKRKAYTKYPGEIFGRKKKITKQNPCQIIPWKRSHLAWQSVSPSTPSFHSVAFFFQFHGETVKDQLLYSLGSRRGTMCVSADGFRCRLFIWNPSFCWRMFRRSIYGSSFVLCPLPQSYHHNKPILFVAEVILLQNRMSIAIFIFESTNRHNTLLYKKNPIENSICDFFFSS